MEIYRDGSPTTTAPESTFVGDVRIGGYFRRSAPSRLAGAAVTFAAGSRTPWKINPSGQTIIVTSGVGRAQVEGEPVVEIGVGDIVWFAPGQAHWEGASGDHAMNYVALQEEGDSGTVQFLAAVTDEQYRAGTPVT